MQSSRSWRFLTLAGGVWFLVNYAAICNSIEPPPVNLCPVKQLMGAKGEPGPIGPAGKDGSPGISGVKGDKGDRGVAGDMGTAGSNGPKGQKGIPGDDGKRGSPGSTGKKGDAGKCDEQCGNVKALEAKLKTLETNYTTELRDIKHQLEYLTTWIHPLGSKDNPAVSCRAILERDKGAPSGPYYIKVKDTKLPGNMQQVYCIMQRTWYSDCPAGLTQIMKIDGGQSTFKFSSALWTNKQMFKPEYGKNGCDFSQTKLATYWSVPFESICVRMRPRLGNGKWKVVSRKIDVKANSLYDLIAPGKFKKTNLNVDNGWKKLLEGSSLQRKCTRQGFNVQTTMSSVRIGVLGDENDCRSPDSYIGLGTEGSSCGRNSGTSCGNEAGCGADRGDQHIQSMGYIYVY